MWNFEKKRAFAFLHNFGGKAGCLQLPQLPLRYKKNVIAGATGTAVHTIQVCYFFQAIIFLLQLYIPVLRQRNWLDNDGRNGGSDSYLRNLRLLHNRG